MTRQRDHDSLLPRVKRAVTYFTGLLRPGDEATKASTYWGRLTDYHVSNDEDPANLARSQWLATDVVHSLPIKSLLEVGTNSGRNLAVIHAQHPDLRLRGIDVNPRAIEFAKAKALPIDFAVADANTWNEDAWDAVLTMSVLDHIPDDAVETLAANIARTAKYVIAVELWDGSPGTRGVYKYSRDTSALFGRHGFTTVRWEISPGQYNTEKSLLWAYVGESASARSDS